MLEEKKEKEEPKGFLASDLLSMLKKQLKALWIIIFLLLVALVGTNMAWLWVFQSYDYVSVDSSGEAPANYIGNDGDIYNGTSESKEKEQKQGN
ncbi:MAG: hypothetical protein HFE57_07050 [Firmicutes bacterium]|nr:hypothetical protein [Bacillota bacterium]